MLSSNNLKNITLALLALLSTYIILSHTKDGIAIFGNDSLSLISAASNFMNGQGLGVYYSLDDIMKPTLRPLTQFPPLISLLISLIGFIGIEPIIIFRYVNAFLMGANIFLIGYILKRVTNSYGLFWIICPVLFLFSRDMFFIHSWALSEPLFVLFSMLGLMLLNEYIYNHDKIFLYMSSLVIGLSVMTRYVGVVLIGCGIVSLLILSKNNIMIKIMDCVKFTTISALFIIMWAVRNILYSEKSLGRGITYNYVSPINFIKNISSTFSSWLFGNQMPGMMAFIIIIIITLFFCYLYYLLIKQKNSCFRLYGFISILIIYNLLYICFLYISKSLFDYATPINYRLLAPLYPMNVLIVLSLMVTLIKNFKNTNLTGGLYIILLIYMCYHTYTNINYIGNDFLSKKDWSNFAGIFWKNSDIMSKINLIPRINEITVYSNIPEGIFYNTGIKSFRIPAKIEPKSNKENKNMINDIKEMEIDLKDRNAILIYFNNINRWLITEKELMSILPLKPIVMGNDGIIYTIDH